MKSRVGATSAMFGVINQRWGCLTAEWHAFLTSESNDYMGNPQFCLEFKFLCQCSKINETRYAYNIVSFGEAMVQVRI
jgi:hypothetical protein